MRDPRMFTLRRPNYCTRYGAQSLTVDPHNPEYYWCDYCGQQQKRELQFCRFCLRSAHQRLSTSGSMQGFARSRGKNREALTADAFAASKRSVGPAAAIHQLARTTTHLLIVSMLLAGSYSFLGGSTFLSKLRGAYQHWQESGQL